MSNELGARIHYAGGTVLDSVEAVRAEARWTAEAGLDGFWVSQIFGVDPFVALAAVAADVPDLAELGTSVVPLYGRHPLAMAALALTANAALGGRFTLGLGPSHQIFVEGVYGEDYRRPFRRTEEYLRALLPLLAGEAADVDGDEVSAHGRLGIEAPPCPVLLAAMGPRMLELAGRTTDGTSLGQACGPKTIAAHIVPRVTAAAEAAGRPAPRVMALVLLCVTDDVDRAYQHAAEHGKLYSRLPAYRAMLDREGVDGPADLLVAGSADAVTEGLRAYVDAGVTDLRLGISAPTPDDDAATRAYLAGLAGGALH